MNEDKSMKRNWALRKEQICEDRKKIYVSPTEKGKESEDINSKNKVK